MVGTMNVESLFVAAGGFDALKACCSEISVSRLNVGEDPCEDLYVDIYFNFKNGRKPASFGEKDMSQRRSEVEGSTKKAITIPFSRQLSAPHVNAKATAAGETVPNALRSIQSELPGPSTRQAEPADLEGKSCGQDANPGVVSSPGHEQLAMRMVKEKNDHKQSSVPTEAGIATVDQDITGSPSAQGGSPSVVHQQDFSTDDVQNLPERSAEASPSDVVSPNRLASLVTPNAARSLSVAEVPRPEPLRLPDAKKNLSQEYCLDERYSPLQSRVVTSDESVSLQGSPPRRSDMGNFRQAHEEEIMPASISEDELTDDTEREVCQMESCKRARGRQADTEGQSRPFSKVEGESPLSDSGHSPRRRSPVRDLLRRIRKSLSRERSSSREGEEGQSGPSQEGASRERGVVDDTLGTDVATERDPEESYTEAGDFAGDGGRIQKRFSIRKALDVVRKLSSKDRRGSSDEAGGEANLGTRQEEDASGSMTNADRSRERKGGNEARKLQRTVSMKRAVGVLLRVNSKGQERNEDEGQPAEPSENGTAENQASGRQRGGFLRRLVSRSRSSNVPR